MTAPRLRSARGTRTRRSPRLWLQALEARVAPAVFTVTNVNNDGPGSLRQATADANALAGADTIDFDPVVFATPRTINLTSLGLSITDSVSISGPGAGLLTVSGVGKLRPFQSSTATTLALTFSKMTVSGGSGVGGGGVRVENANLTLADCVFTGNAAPVLGFGGGGAVFFRGGTLAAKNCSFTGNTSTASGGALYFSGTNLTLDSCTLSGNTSTTSGGAVTAIRSTPGVTSATNSTIAGNTAFGPGGGGVYLYASFSSTIAFSNCTISGNAAAGPASAGGGLLRAAGSTNSQLIQLDGTILSGNTAAADPDASNVQAMNANWSAVGSTAGIATFNNLNSTVGAALRLSVPAFRGGPTMTIAPLPGSAALDQGNNLKALAFDQRGAGFPRVIDDAGIANAADGTDVGAYEVDPSVPVADGTFADVTAPGATSQALAVSYYAYGANTIDLATLGDGDLRVTGPGGFNALAKFTGSVAILNGVAATYAFTPPGGAWDVSDSGAYSVAVEPGQVADSGGKAVFAGVLGGFAARVPGNFVVANANDAGPGSLRQAVLDSNSFPTVDAITFDPAIFATAKTIGLTSGELLVTDSVVIDAGSLPVSVTSLTAARVFNVSNANLPLSVTLSGLTVAGSAASNVNGAGLLNAGEDVRLADCVFRNLTTANTGGAVATTGGTLTVERCTFAGNSAAFAGGAVNAANGATVVLRACTFSGNRSNGAGGGVYAGAANLTLEGCTLSGNFATGGGGVAAPGATAFKAINCTVVGNVAFAVNGTGGGIQPPYSALALIANCTITGNKATASNGKGGGVGRSTTGPLQVDSSIISGNTAVLLGSDLYTNNTVTGNFSAFGSTAGAATFINNNSTVGAALKLSGLAARGGPVATVALLPGSAAIDAGKNSLALATDGRGFARTVDDPAVANASDGTDVGAYEVDPAVPIADGPFADVSLGGAASHTVTVNYYTYGATAIDPTTLDDADIRVTGPGGFSAAAKFVSSTAILNGLAAIYSFTPPGGSWDGFDNGEYTVTVEAAQVNDSAGKAVPAGPAGSFQVTIPRVFTVTNANDAGPGSLRQALLDANVLPTADTVNFDPAFFGPGKSVTLTGGTIAVSESVLIDGSALPPGSVTIVSVTASRVFNIANTAAAITVGLTGLTISGAGIAITNGEAVTATDCVFAGNASPFASTTGGGAVNVTSSTFTAERCLFTGNTAGGTGADGGAISANTGSVVVVRNSMLTGNSAADDGGAVFAASSSVDLLNCTLAGNTATSSIGEGGAVSVQGGTGVAFKAANCTFANNTATLAGGGIHANTSVALTLGLTNCTVTGNTASGTTGKGGGLARLSTLGSPAFQVDGSIVSGNKATTGPDAFTTQSVIANFSAFGSTAGVTVFTNNKTLVGAALNLGPLAFRGGPVMTIAPLPGSAVLDQGNNPSGLATDARGPGFPRTLDDPGLANNGDGTDIGAFEVNPAVPLAEGQFVDVNTASGTSYALLVTYYAYGGNTIDTTTLDDSDIRVTGPGGFNTLAKYTGFSAIAGGVAANYEFTPPGGAWDVGDDGRYQVSLEAGQVFTAPAGQAAAPAVLGGFAVAIPHVYVVTTVADSGPGSLRQAVLDANAEVGVADIITFDPGVFATAQTITLTTGELAITDPVTISGPGAALLTVDAGGKNRHFTIAGPGALTVSLSGMTLTGGTTKAAGADGGSVLVADENVTFTGVTLTKNACADGDGGAVSLSGIGSLTFIDCTISANTVGGLGLVDVGGNGGGINLDTAGSLTLLRSTVSGNTANEDGGGVYFFDGGSLALTDSTVSGNVSTAGALAGVGGGGIYFFGTVSAGGFTVTNSTISGNKITNGGSGGGILLTNFTGTAFIRNSTITANDAKTLGGGIARASGVGTVALQSTIVAGNLVAGNAKVVSADLSIGSSTGSNNLIGIANGAITGTGNKSGSVAAPFDAKLGPLANNGGPTQTHALLIGSPALNAGNNAAALANDQRGPGFARVVGGSADIGAFEIQTPPPTVQGKTLVINGGAAQRSRVTSVTIDFDQVVTFFAGNPALALILARQSDGAIADFTATVTTDTVTHVTLTFTGLLSEAGSLADGRYTLTMIAANVLGLGGTLDGDGNGIGGDNFILAGDPAAPTPGGRLYRLFGDLDGDGDADAVDYRAFRVAFVGPVNLAFDSDGDGDVDAQDFDAFRQRFGASA